MGIRTKIKKIALNFIWRKHNAKNNTNIGMLTNTEKISVNYYSYGTLNVLNAGHKYCLSIGSFCSIAPNVAFILESDHPYKYISTFPFNYWIYDKEQDAISKGDIIVQDDVWIGYGATILSGLTIHQGAVIAAGAVVTKSVPPYAIAAGVPARVIKYRFEAPVINFLLTLDYSQLTELLIREHRDALYTKIDDLKIDEIKKLFSWFPKKKEINTMPDIIIDNQGGGG